MTTKRNPKLEGSNLHDCIPQTGKCPMNCNQCFYNNHFYRDLDTPLIPLPSEVRNGIVRMNSGHDSNIQRGLIIVKARNYKQYFFNTSIPNFDFPGPIVYTANREEEKPVDVSFLDKKIPNLMFVRLRVSPTNLAHIYAAIEVICDENYIPVVLTFMRYYDCEPPVSAIYEKKISIVNECWVPKRYFRMNTLSDARGWGGRLVTMCGTLDSSLCKDCRNCETYYWQTLRYMKEQNE